MITYVDTSVLVRLLVDEPGSAVARDIWSRADDLASVVLVVVEARAALAAVRRAGRLTSAAHRRSVTGLHDLVDQIALIDVTGEVIDRAGDLAESAALRDYDAVHLAGALLVGATVMASADQSLGAAAARQGLHVATTEVG